jgi:hypothetical protein
VLARYWPRCESGKRLSARQTFFHDLAKNVEKKLVRFLDSGGGIGLDQKIDIGKANSGSTVASEKCNGLELTRFRFFQRALDIF